MTTIGIIGTGMIGGSIGIRARELNWRVLGYDENPEATQEARVRGAISEIATREQIDEQADAIVIAAHISGTLAEIERLRCTQPRKARLVIDISSVKAPIVAAARGVRNFVATHPMAGRERSGPAAAAREVFEGKTWLYVPTGDRELDWRAVEFIGAFGAIPVEADAVEHDRLVACTSHLPQVLASLFAARLSRADRQRHAETPPCHAETPPCHAERPPCHAEVSKHGPGIEAFMGPTATELQRLSRSSPAMWRDILLYNRENVCTELRGLAADLQVAADALEEEDAAAIV